MTDNISSPMSEISLELNTCDFAKKFIFELLSTQYLRLHRMQAVLTRRINVNVLSSLLHIQGWSVWKSY